MKRAPRFKKWETKGGIRIIRVLSARSNVFLVTDGKVNILVDTSASRLWRNLEVNLETAGIKSIDLLILTHTHFDHAGNASRIKERFGPEICVHKSEASNIRRGDGGIPAGTTFFTQQLVRLLRKNVHNRAQYDPVPADIKVDVKYDLAPYGLNAYILHTPGHTAGSMSVIVDDQAAIVGDAMFGIIPGSVFPPFGNDKSMLIQSWGKLLNTGCEIFLPSHGSACSRQLLRLSFENRKRISRGKVSG